MRLGALRRLLDSDFRAFGSVVFPGNQPGKTVIFSGRQAMCRNVAWGNAKATLEKTRKVRCIVKAPTHRNGEDIAALRSEEIAGAAQQPLLSNEADNR